MRAYWIIMLCLSFIQLRGQRITKIAFAPGAGISVQPGVGVSHYIFDDVLVGHAASQDGHEIFVGFLAPVFSSSTTPLSGIKEMGVKIFPNPFSVNIRIQYTGASAAWSYLLADLNGRVLDRLIGLMGDHEIKTAHLNAGIYFLSIQYANSHFEIHKLIKL